ncbi:MAG: methionyl-tRNA formyltransferase, partial [Armatimonadota bacterium]
REDARLDVRRTAAQEYHRYRAFTPAPGASLQTAQGVLKVTSARPAPGREGEPGTVQLSENRVLLAFAEGALELREVQLEGRPRRAAREWANGARIVSGDKLVVLE